MKFIIYGLVDPRYGSIRYIGLSSTGFRRPELHRRSAKHEQTPKAIWIRELLQLGLDYAVVVLQRLTNRNNLAQAEKEWIARLRSSEALTNLTSGGQQHFLSEDTKRRIGKASRARRAGKRLREWMDKHPKIARLANARGAATRKGQKRSEATKHKMRLAKLGKKRQPHTEETKAKMRVAALARVEELRVRMLTDNPMWRPEARAKLSQYYKKGGSLTR
jgi:hypothetical protein